MPAMVLNHRLRHRPLTVKPCVSRKATLLLLKTELRPRSIEIKAVASRSTYDDTFKEAFDASMRDQFTFAGPCTSAS